ncbi:hypothetical protein N7540_009515 [Penicillium herquei]|nr:hypothetical protein N7540_009515 [Penicillium herquei]
MAEEKSKEDVVHAEMAEAADKGGGLLKTVGYNTAAEEALREADSPWTVLKANPRIACVMVSALITGIIVGIELNMAGNMLGIQSFCRQFGYWDASEDAYAIPAHIVSIWAAVSSPFQLLGNVASGYLGDFFGRSPVLYLTILTCVAGSCLESFVTNWKGWLGAKIVMGLTTGLMQAGVATYISEIAPRELRGIALSTFNMFMNMGNLFSVLISYGTEHAWPSNKTASYMDCFRGVDLRRSFCAIFPALSQPLCGNVICGPYATYFFSMVGFSNSLSATAIVLCCGFACNIAVFFLVDHRRVGRWAILFGGLTLMFIGDLGIGLVGSIEPNVKSSSAASGLIIFFVCILGCGSFSGPGAVGWTYTGESGSMHLRAKTNTLGNLGNAGIAWVFVSTVSYMIAGMSLNIGYFYAGMTALSMIIVYFFIPDYTSRSFAQIDELFERRIPARKFSKTVCTGDYGHVA